MPSKYLHIRAQAHGPHGTHMDLESGVNAPATHLILGVGECLASKNIGPNLILPYIMVKLKHEFYALLIFDGYWVGCVAAMAFPRQWIFCDLDIFRHVWRFSLKLLFWGKSCIFFELFV